MTPHQKSRSGVVDVQALENGSPTKEFSIARGLGQGDPLSSFRFLIVVEGLYVMIKNGAEVGLFYGYRAEDPEFQISHLQSLKIICFKSKLLGVNVAPRSSYKVNLIASCVESQITGTEGSYALLLALHFPNASVEKMTDVRDAWQNIWSALVRAIWWSRDQLVLLSVVPDGHDPRGCKVEIMELVKRYTRWNV
ncbi:ribonuclease H [Trifolium pratense]|uniref:Ribonuclease H n=1 Tax=Trifolium pratense TaxID=57577 RepID=A0A2K3NWM2_TRIPR|nr:ribonuclease H [Trifolium pratense]